MVFAFSRLILFSLCHCVVTQYNCYFRKQLPPLQYQDVSAIIKLQALVIQQHVTKKLVNLLSNQYTDYQTNTPLLPICNYTIFPPITHNYKKCLFHTLKSYESHTSTVHLQIHHTNTYLFTWHITAVEIYLSEAHPLTASFSNSPEGNSRWIRLQISNASIGACTPPFRRFLLLLFFILFFALFITVSISWNNLFATLVPPLLCPHYSLKTHPSSTGQIQQNLSQSLNLLRLLLGQTQPIIGKRGQNTPTNFQFITATHYLHILQGK